MKKNGMNNVKIKIDEQMKILRQLADWRRESSINLKKNTHLLL